MGLIILCSYYVSFVGFFSGTFGAEVPKYQFPCDELHEGECYLFRTSCVETKQVGRGTYSM